MPGHSPKGFNRLLKNAHLRRYPYPSSLRRTAKYASFLRISGALHLAIFEQPEKDDFSAFCYFRSFSFLSFLMIFGMKKEKTKRPTEKKTLKESN
jgi:hypothetical protein